MSSFSRGPLPFDENQNRQAEHDLQRSLRTFASGNSIGEVAALLRAMMVEPLQLVRAMAAVGSVDRAVEIVEAALRLGLPCELAARLRCLLVELLIIGGSAPEALTIAEDVLATSGKVPDSASAAIAASRMFARYFLDTGQGRRRAESVLLARGGEIDAEPEALAAAAVLSEAVLSDGRLSDALTLARNAAGAAHALPSPVWRPYLHLVLADRLTDAGAYEESENALRAARADMAGTDGVDGAGLAIALGFQRARLLSHRGRLADARDETQRALSAAVGVGARLFVPSLLAFLGQLALWSGDAEGAAALVSRYRDVLAQDCVHLPSIGYDWVEIQVTAAWRGPAAAVQRMSAHYASTSRRSALFVRQPGAAAWFVRTALEAGDRDWAAAAAKTAQQLAERNPGMTVLGVAALHANSLLYGDADGVVRAAAEHRHYPARVSAAEDLTALLHRSAGRAPGGHRPGDGELAGEVPSDEAALLSDAELEVTRLVSKGLTNQQVALRTGRSQHTVNFHLRNIFRKLGVSSRVELAGRMHAWADTPSCPTAGKSRLDQSC